MKTYSARLVGLALCGLFLVSCQAQAAAPVSTPPDNKMTNKLPIGQDFDLQRFIDRAVGAGQKRIVIAPGRYRVKPRDRQHLILQNLQDVQIIADGVEMICTETTRALTISNCRNVTLRGLTIDYDPLPFTQGRITSLSADKSVAEIELFDGFPRAKTAVNFKFEIFKPDTRTLRYDAPGPEKVEAIDDRTLRLSWNRARPNDPEQVGDLIVIGSEDAPGGQIPHGVVLEKSRNVKLENVDLWASNCFGFLENECDGTVYQHCRIDRRPPASDLEVRADARLRSLNADAYHSKDAAKGPQILGCTAKWMGDDAVNICGHYSMVASAKGAELRVLVNGAALQTGDMVELWSYAGVRLPDARVVKVEADGKINEAERAFLLPQRMDEWLRTKWTPDAQRVTLDRAVDVGLGALVGLTQRMGNGFKVQNCNFGFNRSRGILIKASNGEVVGNTIKQSLGPAILVAPEYWWLESGSSNHVLIQRNRIEDCQDTAIEVVALAGKGGIAPSGAHRDITIAGNTVLGCALPNIVATSTAGLRIGGNDLTPSKTRQLSDWALGMLSLDKTKLQAIMAPNCDGPVIKNNVVR